MSDTTMYTFEHELLDLYQDILENGELRDDRTGTGTIATFGQNIRINLADGFPLVTTKKVPFRAVLSELLWFLEGSGDERRLAEILHGTRDPARTTIWSANAAGTTGAKFQPQVYGDLGRVYGVQWRNWRRFVPADELVANKDKYWEGREVKTAGLLQAYVSTSKVDQIAEIVHKLKNKKTDRRIILSAWNPAELDDMALPPCHMFAQFYLSNDNKLSCQMYQRSVDTFLGLPFNIASYALLTIMLAHVVGAELGELIMVLGDTHIYSNHQDQVREQLTREPHPLPTLNIKRKVDSIDDFTMADFELLNYVSDAAISAPMSA
jgi:thymidylate synthase